MGSREQIDVRIREFAAELEGLIKRAAVESLEQALGRVGVSTALPRQSTETAPKAAPKATVAKAGAAPKKVTAKRRAKGAKRSQDELNALTDKLEAFVAANPGKRMEQIGASLGMPTSDLVGPMKRLLDASKVRSEGERRATKYFSARKK